MISFVLSTLLPAAAVTSLIYVTIADDQSK
jgi:hypothetical protein